MSPPEHAQTTALAMNGLHTHNNNSIFLLLFVGEHWNEGKGGAGEDGEMIKERLETPSP